MPPFEVAFFLFTFAISYQPPLSVGGVTGGWGNATLSTLEKGYFLLFCCDFVVVKKLSFI